MALPIFRGSEPFAGNSTRWKGMTSANNIDLYEHVIRPILKDCRVYHHTPLTPMLEGSPWVVLEYATPDSQKDLGWLFRTSESGDRSVPFHPAWPRSLKNLQRYLIQ